MQNSFFKKRSFFKLNVEKKESDIRHCGDRFGLANNQQMKCLDGYEKQRAPLAASLGSIVQTQRRNGALPNASRGVAKASGERNERVRKEDGQVGGKQTCGMYAT